MHHFECNCSKQTSVSWSPHFIIQLFSSESTCCIDQVLIRAGVHHENKFNATLSYGRCLLGADSQCLSVSCFGSTATVRTTTTPLICTCHWHSKCTHTHTHTHTHTDLHKRRTEPSAQLTDCRACWETDRQLSAHFAVVLLMRFFLSCSWPASSCPQCLRLKD